MASVCTTVCVCAGVCEGVRAVSVGVKYLTRDPAAPYAKSGLAHTLVSSCRLCGPCFPTSKWGHSCPPGIRYQLGREDLGPRLWGQFPKVELTQGGKWPGPFL